MCQPREPLSLLAIASNYPSAVRPYRGTFVHTLMRAFEAQGAEVTVIAPLKIMDRLRSNPSLPETVRQEIEHPRVLRPTFVPFSNFMLTRSFSTFRWSVATFTGAARRALRQVGSRPSIVYAHFLFAPGYAACKIASHYGVPAVVALGEDSLDYYEKYCGLALMRDVLSRFAGVLSVSEGNKQYCVERLQFPEDRILVLRNAADAARFYVRDRKQMRQKLGLPAGETIAVFIGHFDSRKGPGRVLRAIRRHPNVHAVFLGRGKQTPSGPQVLFAGAVPHEEVPEWLCAADFFVFPTLSEGSPNAVVEAMACGLPIISSDIPSVREAVTSDAALLVPPEDEQALARAIGRVSADRDLREKMSQAALQHARRFTLHDRAARVLKWMRGFVR